MGCTRSAVRSAGVKAVWRMLVAPLPETLQILRAEDCQECDFDRERFLNVTPKVVA